MFRTSNIFSRGVAAGIDIVIDFATLGEYRVVELDHRFKTSAEDAWAADIEWTAPVRNRGAAQCSLPRARDRELARTRIAERLAR